MGLDRARQRAAGGGHGLIVDVANVVGSRPDGWWRDRVGATERVLAALVAAASQLALQPVVAVLEGQARAAHVHSGGDEAMVEIVRATGSGDDAVVEAARRHPGAVVVTADRRLRQRLPSGTPVMGPAELRRLVSGLEGVTNG